MVKILNLGDPLYGCCDIETYSYSPKWGGFAGLHSRRAQTSDLMVYRKRDDYSSILYEACIKGTVIKDAAIKYFESEESLAAMYTLLLTDVTIKSYQTRGKDSEEMELSCRSIDKHTDLAVKSLLARP